MCINKTCGIILIVMCISTCGYAGNSGYLKIIFKNSNAVPAYKMVIAQQGTSSTNQPISQQYKLTFTDSNLTRLFANYAILDFEKQYPIADSFPDDEAPAVHLRLVYKVIIDTTTGKSYDGLKQDIDTLHSTSIQVTLRAFPAVSLGTPPNDYNLPRSSLPEYTSYWPDPYLQLDLINALNAWNVTTGLSCIKIGIVDQSPLEHHEDLDGKFLHQTTRESIAGSATSAGTHGTFVAGMAGTVTNNGKGVASLGYNIGLRFYSFNNYNDGYPQIVNAIYDKCKVINCSWNEAFYIKSQYSTQVYYATSTYQAPSADVQDVLNLAALNNVTIVAAAGNGTDAPTGNQPNYYVYPASYDGVISVTSVGSQYPVGDAGNYNWKDCHRQWFNPSNTTDYNRYHNNNDRVDICAPGYSVASTWNLGTSTNTIGNGYAAEGGTSFASPQVAAAAGLLYSVNPFFTPDKILFYLKNYGVNIDNACVINGVSDNQQWAGRLGRRLDAGASLQAAASSTYNGPVYCSGDLLNCPTQSTSITTNTILNQSNYFYNYDIVAGTSGSGYVQTSTTAQTAFIAVNSVTLQAGFDANPSTTANSDGTYSYFTAYIEPCSGPVGGREAQPTKKALTAESSTPKGLQLYPNPATNEVNVLFTIAKDEKATLEVANSFGMVVKTMSVLSSTNGSGNATIDIKDLSAGIYYVSIMSTSNKMTKKLIKMKQ